MAKAKLPLYDITDVQAEDNITVARFAKYLSVNPHLAHAHTHSFYHLVYFTRGGGTQVLDFAKVPVKPGIIYFMHPGQMHHWLFDGKPDGYIVNFSPTFFEQALMSSQLVHRFVFFNGNVSSQVLKVPRHERRQVGLLFDMMLQERKQAKEGMDMVLASLLVRLFVLVQRVAMPGRAQHVRNDYYAQLFRKFLEMLEQHYRSERLPRYYASQLYVTPHHLNTVVQEMAGVSTGEFIRNRVVLEAKRLLVNGSFSVEEVAGVLDFEDSSYFVRFFKKYAGQTPEAFRLQYKPDKRKK